MHTLPGLEDPVSFVAAGALFVVETYAIGVFFLGSFIMADPVRHRRPNPVSVEDLPTVDILVPTLNEPAELLSITLGAARNIAYPAHLVRVVLCDDGGTDARCADPDPLKAADARMRREELQALCAQMGVTYMTRAENRHAKAGNLNEALMQLSGDLVVIFDADHAPTRDFLARTVGYFAENPKLFLVQTPHFFLNDDPVARNLGLGAAPPENEMFYAQLHEGLDRWGGAFFCGSAAVLRRAALDEVGGISGNTITEDAETALGIHARGWESHYLNHAMVAGLQPETFGSFIQQRGRWATGMIQLLLTRNPFRLRGLSLFQRLCYFNSMSYWLFPVFRLVLLMAPLSYLFFGIELFVTTAGEAMAFMSSYLIITYVVQNALFGRTRHPFISEIYEIAQAPYLLRAVIGTVLNPRKASFKVTSKTETVNVAVLSDVYAPLLALFGLMLAGLGVLVWRWYTFPGDRDTLQIVGAWAVFNTLLVSAALRAVVEARQRRSAPRCAVEIPALVQGDAQDEAHPARITDISYGGAQLLLSPRPDLRQPQRYSRGAELEFMPAPAFGFEGAAPVRATITSVQVRGSNIALGLDFAGARSGAANRTIAALLNGDSERWRAARAARCQRMGLVQGAAQLLWLSGRGVISIAAILMQPRPAQKTEAAESTSGWLASAPIERQAFIEGPSPYASAAGATHPVSSLNGA
jgi:cellulose synthase (UDP-forming)